MKKPILCIGIKYYNKIGFSGKINLFFSLLIILGERINSDYSLAQIYSENVFSELFFQKNVFLQVCIYKYKFDNEFRFYEGIEIILKIIDC